MQRKIMFSERHISPLIATFKPMPRARECGLKKYPFRILRSPAPKRHLREPDSRLIAPEVFGRQINDSPVYGVTRVHLRHQGREQFAAMVLNVVIAKQAHLEAFCDNAQYAGYQTT
jgi:hypothetical protein